MRVAQHVAEAIVKDIVGEADKNYKLKMFADKNMSKYAIKLASKIFAESIPSQQCLQKISFSQDNEQKAITYKFQKQPTTPPKKHSKQISSQSSSKCQIKHHLNNSNKKSSIIVSKANGVFKKIEMRVEKQDRDDSYMDLLRKYKVQEEEKERQKIREMQGSQKKRAKVSIRHGEQLFYHFDGEVGKAMAQKPKNFNNETLRGNPSQLPPTNPKNRSKTENSNPTSQPQKPPQSTTVNNTIQKNRQDSTFKTKDIKQQFLRTIKFNHTDKKRDLMTQIKLGQNGIKIVVEDQVLKSKNQVKNAGKASYNSQYKSRVEYKDHMQGKVLDSHDNFEMDKLTSLKSNLNEKIQSSRVIEQLQLKKRISKHPRKLQTETSNHQNSSKTSTINKNTNLITVPSRQLLKEHLLTNIEQAKYRLNVGQRRYNQDEKEVMMSGKLSQIDKFNLEYLRDREKISRFPKLSDRRAGSQLVSKKRTKTVKQQQYK